MKRIAWNGEIGYRYQTEDGEMYGITIESVNQDLSVAGGEDIAVELSSFGGGFFEGIQIMNALRQYSGKVTVHLNSIVASAATIISMGADQIIARPSSVFMIHNAISVEYGDYVAMRKKADELEGYTKIIADEYAKKTGKDLEEIRRMMDAETYLFGKEILDEGFADSMEDTGEAVQNKTRTQQFVESRIKAAAKKTPHNIRDFEKYLRESGYSKSQAVAIASGGFRAIANKTQGDKVTKQETLDSLKVLKVNNEITLPEIAEAIGLGEQVVNQAQIKAQAEKISEAEARAKTAEEALESARSEIVSAKLDREFGVKNKLRDYAQDIVGSSSVADFDQARMALWKPKPKTPSPPGW